MKETEIASYILQQDARNLRLKRKLAEVQAKGRQSLDGAARGLAMPVSSPRQVL